MKYEQPEVVEYGSVESITLGDGSNKIGTENDEYSNQTGLVGSVV